MQLTDGARENTFGGFMSPNDRFLYFVRGDRQLIRLDLQTLAEEVAYVVPEGWVGYGTWVPNSACTKMVGIEIAAEDWFPLNTWAKFNEMFKEIPTSTEQAFRWCSTAVSHALEIEIHQAQDEGREPTLAANPFKILSTLDLYRKRGAREAAWEQRAMRSPMGTPRLRMPTIIRSSSPRFFSTTSMAIRRIARFIRAPSNKRFLTFIAGGPSSRLARAAGG